MTKIYIVVDACSGEDYSADDPTILFVSNSYEKAKEFFDDEISNWEDGLDSYYANCIEYSGDIKLIYECTDFNYEYHRVMKLVEKEIQ